MVAGLLKRGNARKSLKIASFMKRLRPELQRFSGCCIVACMLSADINRFWPENLEVPAFFSPPACLNFYVRTSGFGVFLLVLCQSPRVSLAVRIIRVFFLPSFYKPS